MLKLKTALSAGAMALAAISLAAPQAPAFANKGSTAKSAKKSRPSAGQYSRSKTARTPVRQRTAASVVNARAARENRAFAAQKADRTKLGVALRMEGGKAARDIAMTAKPGRAGVALANLTGAEPAPRRARVASVNLKRLIRNRDGTITPRE
ncbi:hypothetical protein [Altererythrobacter sp. ZODW24]|uniref:hypothetical protein n=1 Tax=Altererythrobacter sp. ZODW24 TaxID=2185142 RepID=UPI000DF85BFD|nr:hypothetical protein [Altererythrobacter sp. ZODW24]